ncbi:MAG TPA: HEAT repeat domain-containing protein [Tepidisphaeraceae bacterium]|jgi:hypothetical protein
MRTVSTLALVAIFALSTGCQQVGSFFDRLGGKPLRAARKMEDPYFPDERREGIFQLARRDYGRLTPYTTRYKQIAQSDPDFTVRAAAVRALNIARDKSATAVFIGALSDKNDFVRLEAAKALANVPSPEAAAPLQKIVSNALENKDLRIAAADALKHYPNLGVGRTLVGALNTRDFGVAWQARQSLRRLTGRDLHYDESAWLTYLTSPGRPLG